MMRNTQRDGVI